MLYLLFAVFATKLLQIISVVISVGLSSAIDLYAAFVRWMLWECRKMILIAAEVIPCFQRLR
jgi:hypothetical protein